jgi:hypothetical protein
MKFHPYFFLVELDELFFDDFFSLFNCLKNDVAKKLGFVAHLVVDDVGIFNISIL